MRDSTDNSATSCPAVTPAAVEDLRRTGASSALADSTFPLGAHLVTRHFGYTHHGIYVGAGKVVHYAGLSRAAYRGPVEEVSLADFARGRRVSIKVEPDARYCAETIAARARSRLGENRYGVVRNNCEHFCSWCVHGESRSEQIERAPTAPRAFAAVLVYARRLLRHRALAGGWPVAS